MSAAFASFVTNNGMLLIAGGAAMGKCFNDMIGSVVQDVCMPTFVRAVQTSVMPPGFKRLFKDEPNVINWGSLIRSVTVFIISAITIYLFAGVIFSKAFESLRGH